MRFEDVTRSGLAATVLGIAGFGMTGCIDDTKVDRMPVPEVWRYIEDKSDDSGWVNVVLPDSGWEEITKGEVARAEKLESEATSAMRGATPISALNEMVDEAAQQLATSLAENEDVRASEYQLVMIVGDFNNRSGVDNPGLEQALDSVMRRLALNEELRDLFVFVAKDSAGAEAILSEVSGDWGAVDTFGDDGSIDVAKYHPDYIYIIDGGLSVVSDPNAYLMQLTLSADAVHPRTLQLKEPFELQRRYYYHPAHRWIPEARNEQMRADYEAGEDDRP